MRTRSRVLALLLLTSTCSVESAEPKVAGFQRYSSTKSEIAGKLLLGELNCLACHQHDAANLIDSKQGPVLTNLASRVQPGWIKSYLRNPHRAKPGTTMPDLLTGREESEREHIAAALSSFLESLSESPKQRSADSKAARRGSTTYHRVGCVACHDPRKGDEPTTLDTSIPHGELKAKYTVPSLTQFLLDPLAARPAGRMPHLNLSAAEAADVACFLLEGIEVPATVKYSYFEGSWTKLPDFDVLKPKSSGECSGFDLTVASRSNNFAMRFECYLHVPSDGMYTLYLSSDDGSRLSIDGEELVEVDGVHPTQTREVTQELSAGPHLLRVDFFEAGGEEVLRVEWRGPKMKRQGLDGHVSMNRLPIEDKAAEVDRELVEAGQSYFKQLGCAACHSLTRDGEPVASGLEVAGLTQLDLDRGCLSPKQTKGAPYYGLSGLQRETIRSAIDQLKSTDGDHADDSIAMKFMTFNCYACHERGKTGGIESERNEFFETSFPEMGDEGRIPPHLNGVGDKLTGPWMEKLLREGTKVRPYMMSRMPRFGFGNVKSLVSDFASRDRVHDIVLPGFEEPSYRIKSSGRKIVGKTGLGCISCHNFGTYRSTGIQAVSLTDYVGRLNEDWFQRYMTDPQQFRAGTRMPNAWPKTGPSALRSILDGSSDKQIRAVWHYLSGGAAASPPIGVGKQAMVLVPKENPVIYRNFIAGAGPRAIAVGYPEQVHLAYDANQMRLAMIWHGSFIDAARHWSGRGQGFQPPLGDNVLAFSDQSDVAVLSSSDAEWPKESARAIGYRFRGYSFREARRPEFRYTIGDTEVTDYFEPIPRDGDTGLRRTTVVTNPVPGMWYRAALQKSIVFVNDGTYLLDGAWTVKVTGSVAPILRRSERGMELIVPLTELNQKIVQEYIW